MLVLILDILRKSLKLDKILSDLQTLKNGQQIIYEDLKEEIESLKELYILGKKVS